MLSTKTGKATHLLTGGALALIASLAVTTARADEAVPQNDLLNATLWMQKSVEYKATVMGLFDLAKLRLDAALADPEWSAVPDKEGKDYQKLPVAIISDLDETLLDNNVYEASLVTRNKSFSGKEWTQYVKDEVTKATPGAVDFLKYAASKGVKIFYVTNRNAAEKEATKANLEKIGFPMGDNVDTLLVKGQQPDWTSAKESRIAYIAKDYRVLLLMGDNLGDFSDKASGTVAERHAFLAASAAHWGHDWIMFPNPEYGSWESAAFGGDWKKSPDERRKEKIGELDAWQPAQ